MWRRPMHAGTMSGDGAIDPDPQSPVYGPAYPFHSRFVTVGKDRETGVHRMHLVDEGSGPVVVCLHGNPTWGFLFRNLVAGLRHAFRVIVPDHVGCGLSDRPAGPCLRAADRVGHLEDLLDRLGIDRFSLVMHDWGGPLGTALAVRRPAAVERLVYFNTCLAETDLLPSFIRLAASPAVGRVLTEYTDRFVKLLTSQGVVSPLPDEIRRGYHRPYRTRHDRRAIWGFVRDIPFSRSHPTAAVMADMIARLPDIAAKPVKIIWGMRDPCFHAGIFDRVAARFPHADIVRIPDASHLVPEDAAGLCVQGVRGFLEPLAGGHGSGITADVSDDEAVEGLTGGLRRAAAAAPWATAVTKVAFSAGAAPHYAAIDFATLLARVEARARGLAAAGLRAGERVIMFVTPGAEFLALSHAVMRCGGVPVFIDPGMGRDAVVACMREAEPRGFIGVPRAHLLRLAAADVFRRLRICLVTGRLPVPGAVRVGDLPETAGPAPCPERDADDPALVAFTSGGTGRPKGVIFTGRMLAEQLAVFRGAFGFRAGGQDLPLLPIFSLFTTALGVGSIFPPLDPGRPLAVDPAGLVRVMRERGNETSFGSPTLWTKIAEHCRRAGTSLPNLRRVFMAGAPVSQATLDLVAAACPEAELFTPYGATEALPVTLASAAELGRHVPVAAVSGERGTPVGRAIDGVLLRIVQPATGGADAPLVDCPERTIGEIVVSGPTVSREYLARPAATAASKVRDGERTWHRMGDMGYLDGAGRLYFCGRQAHMVVTPDRVFHSVPVEEIFNRHAAVRRTALVGVDGRPALVVETVTPVDTDDDRRLLAAELMALGAADPVTRPIRRFYFHPSFPVDARHNAKILRDRLADWATGQPAIDIDGGHADGAGRA